MTRANPAHPDHAATPAGGFTRFGALVPVVFLISVVAGSGSVAGQATFVRADGNVDGTVDLGDPIHSLSFLFQSGPALCLDSLDANDDGAVDVADPVFILSFLFAGGLAPPAPFPICGDDPTLDGITCAFAGSSCGGGSGPGPVYPGRTIGTGYNPQSIAVGDFDADGDLDAAVIVSGGVRVLLGDGSGGFEAGPLTPVTPDLQKIVAADLNGDGLPDLAAVHLDMSPDYISILMGDGTGGFGPQIGMPVLLPAKDLAVGDVNGDGIPDLVACRWFGSWTIAVYPGLGGGAFAPPLTYGTDGAESVALGDVDGDGDLDVATSGQAGALSQVTVLRNDGAGAFPFQSSFGSGLAHKVVLGDVNGDGHLDCVTAPSSAVVVYLGDGTGGFQGQATPISFLHDGNVTLGDLDEDSAPDIVLPIVGALPFVGYEHSLCVLMNTGNGTLAVPTLVPISGSAKDVELADFDADGDLDSMTTIFEGAGSVLILSNDGNGDLGSFHRFPTSDGCAVHGLDVGDINGDGFLDAVVCDGSHPYHCGVRICPGNGVGSLASAIGGYAIDGPGFSTALRLGDLDLDGDLDVVTVNSNAGSVSVLLGNGNGTFLPHVSYPVGTNPRDVALADVDSDGFLDVLCWFDFGNSVVLLMGGPAGALAAPVGYTVGNYVHALAIGDLDLDGDSDVLVLAWQPGSSSLTQLQNDGTGNFQLAGTTPTIGESVALGDIDSDGDLDAITDEVLLGNGLGGFTPTGQFIGGHETFSLRIADLDLDGHLDVFGAVRALNANRVVLGNGDGTFGAPELTPSSWITSQTVLGDLDGDGYLDALFGDYHGIGVQLNLTL